MERIYEIKRYIITDKNAVNDIKAIFNLDDIAKENENFREFYNQMYFHMCDCYKDVLETKNVISIGLNGNKTEGIVVIYDKESSPNYRGKMPKLDKEKGYYFEIEEEK